jgi:hypothetical protein
MTKIEFGNKNEHQRIYHTQEGTPYLLRRASQRIVRFNGVGIPLYLVAEFVSQNSVSSWSTAAPDSSISISNCTKPVIPILLNYQAVDATIAPPTPNTLCNYQLPYYTFQTSVAPAGQPSLQNLKPLVKMMPVIEMIEADPSTQTIAYGCRYDVPTFVEDDFIEVQGSAAFIFDSSVANAFNGLPNFIEISNVTVSATISILYFELQK